MFPRKKNRDEEEMDEHAADARSTLRESDEEKICGPTYILYAYAYPRYKVLMCTKYAYNSTMHTVCASMYVQYK